VQTAAPRTISLFAVGTQGASQLLVTAGQNIGRFRSRRRSPKICGAAPIQASSGRTTRHRLDFGGDSQANPALHLIAVCGLRHCDRTRAYATNAAATGSTDARSCPASSATSPARHTTPHAPISKYSTRLTSIGTSLHGHFGTRATLVPAPYVTASRTARASSSAFRRRLVRRFPSRWSRAGELATGCARARRVRKLVYGALASDELARFGAVAVVEGGAFALVVCVSRRAEPVRAGLAAGTGASLEGIGDSCSAGRAGDPPRQASRPKLTRADRALLASLSPSAGAAGLGSFTGRAGDGAALAPPADRAPVDVRAPPARAAAARALAARVDPSSR
jgi:transposase IS116/IS110/IS902 family protein